MTAVFARLAVLAAVVAGAWLVVALLERRSTRRVAPAGTTLVTGPGCSLCDAARAAGRRSGLEWTEIDVRHPTARSLGVRSVPTLVVADRRGRIRIWRSGRSVIAEISRMAGRAA